MSRVLRLRVTGRVQGVGFRWFVREQARRSNIAGWVRNNLDGTVEVAASGELDALERFTNALHHGPPGAAVASVEELADASDEALPTPFAVLR